MTTKRSISDLSGSESIRYMKVRNIIKIFGWGFMLVICFFLMWFFIDRQYRPFCDGESIEKFQQTLVLSLICILILSVLWWFGTINEFWPFAGMRDFFERYSFACSVIFIVLAFFCVFLLNLFVESRIYAKNRHPYQMYCTFILPAVFAFLMYFAPPINIQRVIFPGKYGRWAACAIAALAAIALFVIDFI